MRALVVRIVIALLLLAPNAAALRAQDSLEFVAPQVGLTIDYNDGSHAVFQATEGTRTNALITYAGDTIPQPNAMQDVFWFVQRRSERANLAFTIKPAPGAAVWPLRLGKRVDYTYDALQDGKLIGHGTGILRVLGTERINIPAGAYAAWLVESDAETTFGGDRKVRAIQRYWYVAEFGTYVMIERTVIDNGKRTEPQIVYATRIQQAKQ